MKKLGFWRGHDALKRGRFSTNTILCSNDRLAIGLLTACYEQGIRVGRGEACLIRVAGTGRASVFALHLSAFDHDFT